MRFLRTVGWTARKELLRFSADPLGALFTLTVPVMLAVLMSTLFAPHDRLEALPLLVASEQAGPRVDLLLQALEAEPTLAVERVTTAEARTRVLAGDAAAAVLLPPEAEGVLQPLSMFSGAKIPVQILYDPSRETEVDILEGLLTRETMGLLSSQLATVDGRTQMFRQIGALTLASPLVSPVDKPRWSRFATAGAELGGVDGVAGSLLEIERQTLDVFNAKALWNPHAHYFAGMLTMFLLFLAATSALNLIIERDEGALTRVMLTGASPTAVLLGGALGTTVIAFVAALVVYATGILVFGIQVGDPVGLAAMLVAISHLVGGFSLLLSAVGNTARQISTLAPFAILVMGFVGGSALPSFMMPGWVQTLAVCLPTTWANEGLAAATWRGGSTIDCLFWAAGVFGFGALFAAAGVLLFRWR